MENAQTTTTEQAAPAPQLNLNDLAAVVQMIDVCSRRGAYEGPELAAIGALRTRFADFLKANAPKEQPKQDGETVAGDKLPGDVAAN
jgi:hypothetical protein